MGCVYQVLLCTVNEVAQTYAQYLTMRVHRTVHYPTVDTTKIQRLRYGEERKEAAGGE